MAYTNADLQVALRASNTDRVSRILRESPDLASGISGEQLAYWLDRVPELKAYNETMRRLKGSAASTGEGQIARNTQLARRLGGSRNVMLGERLGAAQTNEQALADARTRRGAQAEFQKRLNASDRHAGSGQAASAVAEGLQREALIGTNITGAIGAGGAIAGSLIGGPQGALVTGIGQTVAGVGQGVGAGRRGEGEEHVERLGRGAVREAMPQYAVAVPSVVSGTNVQPIGGAQDRSYFRDAAEDEDDPFRWGQVYS